MASNIMKNHYKITVTSSTTGQPVHAYVRAGRLTSAVRLALQYAKARSFDAVQSIARIA
jgi:hypothetical protein